MKRLRRSIFACILTGLFIILLLVPEVAAAASQSCGRWRIGPGPRPAANYGIFHGIATVSATDAWVVGAGQGSNGALIERWNGLSWSIVSSPQAGTGDTLYGVSVVSANNIWAVGVYWTGGNSRTLIEHWNGTKWSIVLSPSPVSAYNELHSVVAVSKNDVWAVGDYQDVGIPWTPLVEHWNGTKWAVVPSPNVGSSNTYLYGVAAISTNNILAVGYSQNSNLQTVIEQWNGLSWSIVPSPNPGSGGGLQSVAIVSASDVWAVGFYQDSNSVFQTLVEHWNGTNWNVIPSPSPGMPCVSYFLCIHLNGVAAVSANDVWAVGYYTNTNNTYQTLIEQWNGTSWNAVSSPNIGMYDNSLFGVAASSSGNVWTVGYYNYYQGQTLTEFYC